MRLIFMGTPDYAKSSLQALIDAGHDIELVVTNPDKPKGRSKENVMPPVKMLALEHNIPVYQPVKLRSQEAMDYVMQYKPDAIIVVAFGQIVPKQILDLPKYGCINVHGSLLPEYRGAAPIQWAVIDGKEVAGVTTMLMNEGIDTGDMLLRASIKLDKKETGGSLFDKLAQLGAELLIETLVKLEEGSIVPQKQDESKSTYVGMLKKEMGNINFNKTAVEIERLVRGLNPWPSAFTKINGKMLKVWDCDVVEGNFEGANGEIIQVTKDGIIVKTSENAIKINELQYEGKKRMNTKDFLLGTKIETGIILGE